ncbi:MAG: type II toxin-antitoxin system PemK/MazF family toxin [Chloroflexi bacterium]|nr:type II toxin-antitoxin system PemK/MazF family toxin [Chloroflexota bacterium]
MGVVASRFDVFLVRLDPTEGHEIQKTRPCPIISPNEMNRHISTVLIAPMTTRGRPYPTRVPVTFQGTMGQIVLHQIRAVDGQRLVRKLGRINRPTADDVLAVLAQMFAP